MGRSVDAREVVRPGNAGADVVVGAREFLAGELHGEEGEEGDEDHEQRILHHRGAAFVAVWLRIVEDSCCHGLQVQGLEGLR